MVVIFSRRANFVFCRRVHKIQLFKTLQTQNSKQVFFVHPNHRGIEPPTAAPSLACPPYAYSVQIHMKDHSTIDPRKKKV